MESPPGTSHPKEAMKEDFPQDVSNLSIKDE
jgi:hypothetical protein